MATVSMPQMATAIVTAAGESFRKVGDSIELPYKGDKEITQWSQALSKAVKEQVDSGLTVGVKVGSGTETTTRFEIRNGRVSFDSTMLERLVEFVKAQANGNAS